MRIAGAPISWGVCEVPGWGHQMTAERVLTEMRAPGIEATEFGPDGFLPADPDTRAKTLASHGLAAVGGFVPVVLHDATVDPVADIAGQLDAFLAAGAGTVVPAASTGADGYDTRPDLDASGWRRLLSNLDRIADLVAGRGLTAVLHPHVGTMVEGPDDVERVLTGSTIALCLDTGHLLIGGSDPVELACTVADRIAHVHLKDVDRDVAERVRAGQIGYHAAVAAGMYLPQGAGDVDIAAIVAALNAADFDGWYVMEQDAVLTAEPEPGAGPQADARAGMAYLRGLA